MIDLQKTFEEFDDEYRNFDKVENALSARADLCALLLLDKLLPSDINIIDFDRVNLKGPRVRRDYT